MQLIDGKALAERIQGELRAQIETHTGAGRRAPHLAAVLVGDNPASRAYVRNKMRACERTGMRSTLLQYPESVEQSELSALIQSLNQDPEVDGFIVQLPLPRHLDERALTLAIRPEKDVDGFHPVNLGKMTLGLPQAYLPATPLGILKMLEYYQIETSGKHAIVLGRSAIVGTPMSVLLSRDAPQGNCTVTLAHSRTRNLSALCAQADIVVAAVGRIGFVKADMVKEGAVVIDVGINTDPVSGKLVGDVDFEAVAPKCSYITPVPGGVGPMTVTALLINTLKAYEWGLQAVV